MTKVQDLIRATEEVVKKRMALYDPSHDWAHVNRVRKLAMRIAQSMNPKPDLLVVELAALCHDLNAKYKSEGTLESMLTPIFKPYTPHILSPSQATLIFTLIPNVSYSTESKLVAQTPSGWTQWHRDCLELHCVQDADRLDAVGGVGIMRCSAFSGAMGRTLIGREGNTAEAHFYDKLLNIRDRIKTAWGRKEAERRHETMLAFLRALDEEAALLE